MKKFNVVTGIVAGVLLGWATNMWGASQQCSLPDQIISYRVIGNATSFTPTQLSDVPSGHSVSNRVYEGWCVQYDTFIAAGPVYHGGLYDTYGTLPVYLRNLPWDKVNYLLNHKRGDAWDVQFVVWYVLGQAPNPPSNTPQDQMIADVMQNGAGFVPSHGQIVGTLVESQEGVQRMILETIWDERCRDTVAPMVAMATPAANSVYTESGIVPLAASAQDNIGVTRVEFYYGNQLVHTCTAPPYNCPWPVTEANNGTHQWSVKAYDYAGNSMATAPLAVTVSIDVVPPTVAITSPATESHFSTAQTVALTVAASDNFGVTRVELFDRGVLKATLTSAPYVYQWAITAANNGTHNWTARAYDAAGNSNVSAVTALDVAIDAEPPSIFFTAPASGTRLTTVSTVSLQVQAFDNFGVTRVEFIDGATLMGTRTEPPYALNWPITSALNGTHQWTARAYDAAGLSMVATAISLEVAIDDVAPVISFSSPAAGTVYSSAQTVLLTVNATDNFGVARVDLFDGPTLLATRTQAPYIFSWPVSAAINGTHQWTARAYDAVGHSSDTAPLALTVDIDVELPLVSITTPAEGVSLTNQLVVVQGTASDNKNVQRVEYQVDDGAYLLAQGTTSWQVQLALTPGTHSVRVRSIDTAGHVSISVLRTFRYFETGALQVRMTGAGSVTPNLNGAPLELNKTYQLMATPAIGFSFSNWSGGVLGGARQLDFVMQPNLIVQANFISTPFQPVAATYNGLFYQSQGIEHPSSGYFDLSTTARKTFSAVLLFAGQRVKLSGTFDAESKVSVAVARKKMSPLLVKFHLFTLNGQDYVQGSVSDGVWTSDLIGDRVAFYPRGQSSPYIGSYTVVMPADPQVGPGGNGFGSVSVDKNGGVRFSATLGDGTRMGHRTYASASGQWPLYAGIYKPQGSVSGWLNFTNSPQDDLVGDIAWNKPSNARDRVYPAGFTNVTSVIGSKYVYTKGVVVPNLTEAVVHFQDGGLAQNFSNLITIDYRNRVINQSTNALSLGIAPKSGSVSGKVIPPGNTRWVSLQGIVHQKRNVAYGQFTGTGVTGPVRLEAR